MSLMGSKTRSAGTMVGVAGRENTVLVESWVCSVEFKVSVE